MTDKTAPLIDLVNKPAVRLRHGLWWPKFDKDPEAGYAELMKGLPAADIVAKQCERRRTVIQAGGHVGMWPVRLSRYFERVVTFEPCPATFRCLERNIQMHKVESKVQAFKSALGSSVDVVKMRMTRRVGTWRVDEREGTFDVPQTTVDAAQLTDVDAIILDVEGYEVDALLGATATIARCHPVIHVEELPRSRDKIRAHLRELGYRMAREFGRDRTYEWERPWR